MIYADAPAFFVRKQPRFGGVGGGSVQPKGDFRIMKTVRRIAAVITALLMCPLPFSAAAYAEEPQSRTVISSASSYNNVAGGFTFIEEAGDEASLTAKLDGEPSPGAFVFYPDKNLELYDSARGKLGYSLGRAFELLGPSARAVLYISDRETVNSLVNFLLDSGNTDVFFMSDSLSLLASAKELCPSAGAVADYRKAFDGVPDRAKLAEIVTEMNIASASVALFADGCVNQESVRYLYGHFILSWVCASGELTEADALDVILSGAFAALGESTELLYKAATEYILPNTVTRFPLNIGHRGSPNHAQENSVESVLTADREGADAAEIDIYITTDGIPVIHHDAAVGEVNVEDLDLVELRRAAADKSVPTLAEIFEAVSDSDIDFFLEIKSGREDACEKISEVILEYGMADRCSIISFSAEQLDRMKGYLPGISRALLVGSWNTDDPDGTVVGLAPGLRSAGTALDITIGGGASSFDALVVEAHSRGIAITVWTFVHPNQIYEYIGNGSAALTVDIPDVMNSFYRSLEAELEVSEAEVGDEIRYKARFVNGSGDRKQVSGAEVTVPGSDDKFRSGFNSLTFTEAGNYRIYVKGTVDLGVGFEYSFCSGPLDIVIHEKVIPGDVNGDGKVGMPDIVMLIRYLSGWSVEISERAADMNSDSNISMADLVLLIRATV